MHLHIGGEARTSGSGGVHQHVYPATGEIQGPVPLAGPDDVDASRASRARGVPAVARLPAGGAGACPSPLAELMERDIAEIARLWCWTTGCRPG